MSALVIVLCVALLVACVRADHHGWRRRTDYEATMQRVRTSDSIIVREPDSYTSTVANVAQHHVRRLGGAGWW